MRELGKCFNQFKGEIREPQIYIGWMNMEINLQMDTKLAFS